MFCFSARRSSFSPANARSVHEDGIGRTEVQSLSRSSEEEAPVQMKKERLVEWWRRRLKSSKEFGISLSYAHPGELCEAELEVQARMRFESQVSQRKL